MGVLEIGTEFSKLRGSVLWVLNGDSDNEAPRIKATKKKRNSDYTTLPAPGVRTFPGLSIRRMINS